MFILILDKVMFKVRSFISDKEIYFIKIKMLIYLEDIIILNIQVFDNMFLKYIE